MDSSYPSYNQPYLFDNNKLLLTHQSNTDESNETINEIYLKSQEDEANLSINNDCPVLNQCENGDSSRNIPLNNKEIHDDKVIDKDFITKEILWNSDNIIETKPRKKKEKRVKKREHKSITIEESKISKYHKGKGVLPPILIKHHRVSVLKPLSESKTIMETHKIGDKDFIDWDEAKPVHSPSPHNSLKELNPIKRKIKYKLQPIVTPFLQAIQEKEVLNDRLQSTRKLFGEKEKQQALKVKEKYYTYVILPGNASYLIKNCMLHRTNWRESESKVTTWFNFKWQQNTSWVNYQSLSSMKFLPQMFNHFEFHSTLSNKSNMFANIFTYCEKHEINVFKYIPFTIVLSQGNSNQKAFETVFSNINDYVYPFDKLDTCVYNSKSKKKIMINKIYQRTFCLSDPSNEERYLGSKTLISIPSTHYTGKNMWIVKATNLNRGQCIRLADSIETINDIVKQFQSGIKFDKINKDDNETNQQVHETALNNMNASTSIPPNSVYKADKIIIQKYIESPFLYKGRKCDFRIWAMWTHDMKVYVYKEGHLKTCSTTFDINNCKDAHIHITNYSYQKHWPNFQKFEFGNELPFFEFQSFLDTTFLTKGKKVSVQKDIMKKINEIVWMSMKSVRDRINIFNRQFTFEIFGFDFMLDSDLNAYLIEINTNPGIEESSPWIKVIIPRMLDDAWRWTIDKVFDTKYALNRDVKMPSLKDCGNSCCDVLKTPENSQGPATVDIEKGVDNDEDGKAKIGVLDINISNSIEDAHRKDDEDMSKRNRKENNKNNNENEPGFEQAEEYISPFPVPGYSNSANLWEFLGSVLKEKKMYTGIKHWLYRKNESNGNKANPNTQKSSSFDEVK